MANPTTKPTTTTLIKKKKKWYTVVAPKDLNSTILGEIPASEPEMLAGKTLKINLMTITNDMKKQNMVAKFRVTGIKDSLAETELVGYEVTPSYIRRLAKRARTKIDDSFKCETKDKQKLTIKTMLLAKNKLQRNVQTSLRMAARVALADEASKKTFIEMVSGTMRNESQKALKSTLKKVYPVSMVEIRVLELA